MIIQKSTIAKLSAIALAISLTACSGNSDQDDSNATSDMNAGAAGVGSGSVDTGAGVQLETVFYFDFDKSTLRPETQAALDAQAAALANTSNSIVLEGHADERGTREYNLALGERRAKAIAEYLTLKGIAAGRIEVVSFGEEKPVSTGHDEGSWQQNRRVELK